MYETGLSALHAFGDGMAWTAHNVANINTPDYQSWSNTYTEGPVGGVRSAVSPSETPPLTVDRVSLSLEAAEAAYGDKALPSPTAEAGYAAGYDFAGLAANNVDLARETTDMILAQRGFEANALYIAVRAETDNSLLGMLVDYRV